ncbi:RNA polymerase sigma-70 factor [Streptomyces sp. MUM 203J]|nr:RNA polymerase sigma-70 factor [Streptomyces sp. MUM 203J]
MFGLAYRMLGSAEEAEDVVQDAFLRWNGADRDGIDRPGAWLAKVITNLCLNRLTSARAQRERYTGPWLPEPVVTESGALGPLESAEQRDAVSTALLVLLERLTPTERAVYVLREAFAYSHREIAGVLDVSEANSRQLYRRAAARIAAPENRLRAEVEEARLRELVKSFITASQEGDLAGLEKLLTADVTFCSDGGGAVRAALRPIEGRDKVLRFLTGPSVRAVASMRLDVVEINGAPALVARAGDTLVATASFEVRGGAIAVIRSVLSPAKLAFVERQLTEGGQGWSPSGAPVGP